MLSKYEDKNTRMQPLYPRPRAQCSLILVAHHPYFAQCAIIIVARGITEKILSESGTILQGHNLSRERAENCEKVSKLLEMTVEFWSAKLNEARACRERRARNRKWPYNATSYPILFLASGFVHRNRGRECNWTRGEMLLALHRNVFRFCFVLLKDRQRMRRRLSLSLSLCLQIIGLRLLRHAI